MDCPLCFAEARPGFSLTLEEVEEMLDDFVRTEGNPKWCSSPAASRPSIRRSSTSCKPRKHRGIPIVMLNTNGKRIAHDDRFLEQLAEVRPVHLLSVRWLRQRDLSHHSRRARHSGGETARARPAGGDRPQRHSGSRHRARRERARNRQDRRLWPRSSRRARNQLPAGVPRRPPLHARSDAAHDHSGYRPADRSSRPKGKFVASDFVPVPCCFPTCNSVTYAFIDGEKVTPLPRIVNVDDYLDYITNRVMPDFGAGDQAGARRSVVLFGGRWVRRSRRAVRLLLPGLRPARKPRPSAISRSSCS